jgi:acyl-homoserine-lactone acylase
VRPFLPLIAFVATACRPDPTEILWDTWGVPHVYAPTSAGVFEAFGYAQAQSHGDLILRLYAQGRGRAAEVYGPTYLDSDRYVRTMGIPTRAREWYDAQAPEFRSYLDAFAAGVNRFAGDHPDQLSAEAKAVLPVDAIDVLAHTQRVIHFTFVFSPQQVQAAVRSGAPEDAGSNMWAIGPSRSASGKAMLLANPHLAWSDLFLFYEAHLNGPGTNLYGATLVGFPILALAFNERLGWSHTVNTYDGADVYRLTRSGDGYRLDGEVKPFESETEVIRVKQADGSFRDDTLAVRRAVHGPVVHQTGGEAYAARVAGLDQPGMLQQWWDMGRAGSFAEFEAIVKRLQIPMFNVMYADRDGHIYYLFGGRVPERPAHDFGWWEGIIPGDSSGLIWTSTLPYERLPRLLDPPTGWLQNANDPPWTSAVPIQLQADSFPAYVAPRGMGFRPQRSAHMAVADSSITFDELVGYKHDTRMELADRILDDLLPLAERGSDLARRAAAVLGQWDRRADAGSRGAVLFARWAREWLRTAGGSAGAFATAWSPEAPITTPDGIRDPAAALRALEAAARMVEKSHGMLEVTWGDAHRLRFGGQDLPGNGAPGDPFGVFRTAYFGDAGPDGKAPIVGGDTYYAVIEFGDPVRAKVLLAYGTSSQPGSKHLGDQVELFSRQEMRDALLTRAAVEANLEARTAIR